MKYLCLVAIDEKKLEAMSKSESDALDAESLAPNLCTEFDQLEGC